MTSGSSQMLDSISVNVGYDEDIEKIKDYM